MPCGGSEEQPNKAMNVLCRPRVQSQVRHVLCVARIDAYSFACFSVSAYLTFLYAISFDAYKKVGISELFCLIFLAKYSRMVLYIIRKACGKNGTEWDNFG